MPSFLSAAITAVLFCAVVSPVTARVFTSSSGSQVEAELIAATETEVTLLTSDDRIVKVGYEQLSEVDRTYLKERLKSAASSAPAHMPAVVTPPTAPAPVRVPTPAPPPPATLPPGALKVTWTKDRIGNKLQPTNRNILLPGIHEDWVCHFQVNNSSRVPVDGLKLQYEIYCKMKSRSDERRTRTIKGSVNLPLLDGFRNVRVDSEKMVMSATAYPQILIDSEGRTYKSGRNYLFVEEIEGVVVTLVQNGTTIHEYVSPGLRDEVLPQKR